MLQERPVPCHLGLNKQYRIIHLQSIPALILKAIPLLEVLHHNHHSTPAGTDKPAQVFMEDHHNLPSANTLLEEQLSRSKALAGVKRNSYHSEVYNSSSGLI